MAGHVRKHGDKYQAVVVDGHGRGANRRYGEPRTRKSDATDDLAIMQSELMRGVFVDRQAGRVSLADRMRHEIDLRSDRSYNTTESANNALMHVERYFGTRSIATIKHSDMQAFVSSLDLAPSTVRTVWGHVVTTVRSAMADGIVGRDPTLRVKLPKPVGSAMQIPTDADVERLHRFATEGFAVAIVLAAGCGLRAQETAGLVVDDVDFLRRELRVHRQWHGKLDRFEDLKTSGSTRIVPVGDDILSVLAAHIGDHGVGQHELILHIDGQPLDRSLFQSRWGATRKRAGLVQFRFHSLRHHFASTAISAGVPLPALSRALGHSQPSITLNVYGHLMQDDNDRLRSATTARFGRKEAM